MDNESSGPSAREVLPQVLSNAQHLALRAMEERNTGAVLVGDEWIWPVDIRENEQKAVAVLGVLGDDAQDLATIRHEMTEATAPLAIGILEETPLVNPDLAPRCQVNFVHWVQENYTRVFRQKVEPVGPKPIRPPRVPGLCVYGLKAFGGHYYAAWTAHDGRFFGWLWYGPSLSRIDHEFAIGSVIGWPAFGDWDQNRIRRKPVAAWARKLREAAVHEEVV